MIKEKIADPEMDCWDYVFQQNGVDRLWIARPKHDKNQAITYNVGGMWRYLLVADTEESIRSQVSAALDAGNAEDVMSKIEFEQVSLIEILSAWRFIRYEGRNVCAFETNDESVVIAQAFPSGPVCPTRNGFLYLCYNRKTGKPLGQSVGDDVIPLAANSISEIISLVCDKYPQISTEDVLIEHMIVASNLITASMEHPIILWNGKVFPLHDIMQINPNHNPNDPEEYMLDHY